MKTVQYKLKSRKKEINLPVDAVNLAERVIDISYDSEDRERIIDDIADYDYFSHMPPKEMANITSLACSLREEYADSKKALRIKDKIHVTIGIYETNLMSKKLEEMKNEADKINKSLSGILEKL